MRILIDIGHPAHVHLFKNLSKELEMRGHNVFFSIRNIPIVKRLMDIYGIKYYDLGNKRDSLIGKAITILKQDYKLYRFVKYNKIDIGISSGICLPHISKITNMRSFTFDDDDDNVEPFVVKYGHPYSDIVFTPDVIHRKTKNALYYAGLHELAYFHPNRFQPDDKILDEVGISKGDTYFILRFNAFKAHHDIGIQGLSIEDKRRLIAMLEKKGRVFITTERNIDEEFIKHQIRISPEKIHSLLFYATMLIGDSQTMTSEAAVLGVPSIRCNSFAGRISYLEEEEQKYHLTFGFKPTQSSEMFDKIEELLSMSNLKDEFQARRQKLLADKIDVTAFYVWFIENYPESKHVMMENPECQYKFK